MTSTIWVLPFKVHQGLEEVKDLQGFSSIIKAIYSLQVDFKVIAIITTEFRAILLTISRSIAFTFLLVVTDKVT